MSYTVTYTKVCDLDQCCLLGKISLSTACPHAMILVWQRLDILDVPGLHWQGSELI